MPIARHSTSSRSRRARDRLSEPLGARKAIAAAVCFRRRDRELQFRLVRTSDGGRWTFPSGPPGLDETLHQAAAREAAEKAGVSGVVAEKPLTEYRYGRRGDDLATAFLLAVQSAAPYGGSGRNPTWFDLRAARQKLADGRDGEHARELQRVLQLAEHELQER